MSWSVWFLNRNNWFITKIWLKRFIHKSDIDMSLITFHENLFLTQSYHVASEDLGYSAWVIWSTYPFLFDCWKQVPNTILLNFLFCVVYVWNDLEMTGFWMKSTFYYLYKMLNICVNSIHYWHNFLKLLIFVNNIRGLAHSRCVCVWRLGYSLRACQLYWLWKTVCWNNSYKSPPAFGVKYCYTPFCSRQTWWCY